MVKRSYEDFRVLDKHLHLCIYDRRFSQLPELPRLESLTDLPEARPHGEARTRLSQLPPHWKDVFPPFSIDLFGPRWEN